jgi:starch synthase
LDQALLGKELVRHVEVFFMAMRVLYVTSEVFPLAKTGGLADVSAALPAALRERDIDVRLLVPGYPQALQAAGELKDAVRLGDPLGCGEVRLFETRLPHGNVPVWLIDCPALYDRGGGLYQTDNGEDWPDNALRFALLNHVAVGIANEPGRSWRPDIVHAHDWHAGLAPLLLSRQEPPRPATVFTVHNLAYQGLFDAHELPRLDLPPDAYAAREFYGRISFLKAGIQSADAITTVSPTYANEILTEEYGCGLDGLLRQRADVLTGILNGVDYRVWDPSTDPYLACNYSARSFAAKADCKRAIQKELNLQVAADVPLMAFMSRLVHQKMPDVVLDALPALLEDGMQFVLVGEGDNGYEDRFRELAARYPGRVAVEIGYEEPLGHRLLGGADMLLHPARFEPCGLVPIYAMRYGAIPVVRRSGGMADSVTDATPEAIRQGTATGLSFDAPTAEGLTDCVRRALSLYRQPISWRRMQAAAMRQDFSWQRSADAYADLYQSLVGAAAMPLKRSPAVQPAVTALEKLTA